MANNLERIEAELIELARAFDAFPEVAAILEKLEALKQDAIEERLKNNDHKH